MSGLPIAGDGGVPGVPGVPGVLEFGGELGDFGGRGGGTARMMARIEPAKPREAPAIRNQGLVPSRPSSQNPPQASSPTEAANCRPKAP